MASLLDRLRRQPSESRFTLEDYAKWVAEFTFNGAHHATGLQQTGLGEVETVPSHFPGLVRGAYEANGVVFACMLARLMVFSAARFQWQQMRGGRPTELFGTDALRPLEEPWQGGTTQDLLTRMIQDADLAGNSYWTIIDGQLVRLRPDWVGIVHEPRMVRGGQVGVRKVGFVYQEGGFESRNEPVSFLPNDVAHFAPIPDPLATWRGMSWLTPIVREISGDTQMGKHKNKFFENGATPNLAVKFDPSVGLEAFRQFKQEMDAEHKGAENAYKTLYLGGGADVTPVGTNFQEMEFKATQGHGETRIAAAAGVPPIIVGLSEGLASATYSNYGQARRRFADGTIHPLWQNAAGSLSTLFSRPQRSTRLWYDARDVPFLREDEKDAAEIQSTRAATIARLVEAGFRPEEAVKAVATDDLKLLQDKHTGLFSVQLQEAGSADEDPPVDDDEESGRMVALQPR